MGNEDEIPRIRIVYIGSEKPTVVEYIERGIEEEGVPWVVLSENDGQNIPIAYDASINSSLSIGISVTGDRIIIHHKQLPDDEPVFDISDATASLARKLGSNSARLAKGTPLKDLEIK